jgi:hypothetical protein
MCFTKLMCGIKSLYCSFVYSSTNNRYLQYVIERPKGKYEIPTLFCSAYKEGQRRVSIQVRVLLDMLSFVVSQYKDIIISSLSKIEIDILNSLQMLNLTNNN